MEIAKADAKVKLFEEGVLFSYEKEVTVHNQPQQDAIQSYQADVSASALKSIASVPMPQVVVTAPEVTTRQEYSAHNTAPTSAIPPAYPPQLGASESVVIPRPPPAVIPGHAPPRQPQLTAPPHSPARQVTAPVDSSPQIFPMHTQPHTVTTPADVNPSTAPPPGFVTQIDPRAKSFTPAPSYMTDIAHNEQILATYKQLATAITLPQPEVAKFDGDVTQFNSFIMSFEARILSRTSTDIDRLYYLDQHLRGEAKELISGCLYMEPSYGYPTARTLLQNEYGDPIQGICGICKKGVKMAYY